MERSKSRRGKACVRGLVLISLVCTLWACVPQNHKATAPLPRANPVYVQWLERQSMLAAVPQYTRVVSGTELLWRAPMADDPVIRINTLLEAADMWLFVQPQLLLTEHQRPVLAELATPATIRLLKSLGFGGVYMLPTAESSALWGGQDTMSTGEDANSLTFAAHVGTESQYADLALLAAREQLQWGSGLVPAAIGLGPDFFLAARHVRDYPGTLMMVDVPKEVWSLLPPTLDLPLSLSAKEQNSARQKMPVNTENLSGIALQGAYAAAFTALVEKNILPPALLRDTLPWATPGAWAATPPIEGIDGVERRFVYRFYDSVQRPVLQWDDPSKNAQRILSASIIRTIGNQQQTIGGLYPEAWVGLDSITSTAPALSPSTTAPLSEPATSALRALSREIRRYGGWSMQADVFPPRLTKAILDTGVDFTTDSITAPTAEYALLTGDTLPLQQALKNSLAAGVDHTRLVRSLPHYAGLDLRPLLDSPQGRNTGEKLTAYMHKSAWASQAPLKGNTLHATAATLAAMAAGLSPAAATQAENAAPILIRHMLLTTLRAGMPGLLFVSGQDLVGALNLPASSAVSPAISAKPQNPPASSTLGAWALSPAAAAAISSRTGHPRAPSVYGSIATQQATQNSYVQQVAKLAAVRKQWGIARATLLAVPDTSYASTIALLLKLPTGKHALTIANFSDQPRNEQITLEASTTAHHARDALSPAQSLSIKDQLLRLELDPWQCRLIHVD
ncbi:MAG: hypothetical protein RRY29_08130 [Desulfovibrionaceae bacterium]